MLINPGYSELIAFLITFFDYFPSACFTVRHFSSFPRSKVECWESIRWDHSRKIGEARRAKRETNVAERNSGTIPEGLFSVSAIKTGRRLQASYLDVFFFYILSEWGKGKYAGYMHFHDNGVTWGFSSVNATPDERCRDMEEWNPGQWLSTTEISLQVPIFHTWSVERDPIRNVLRAFSNAPSILRLSDGRVAREERDNKIAPTGHISISAMQLPPKLFCLHLPNRFATFAPGIECILR